MRFKPLPGKKCLQSVFAICNSNRTILARTPPWGELPAECICNLQLQPDDLGSNPSLGRNACRVYLQSAIAIGRSWLEPLPSPPWGEMPAECICNLQLQPSICNWAAEHLQLQPNICNCSRTSAIAAEHLQLQPWVHLQLQPSICNCSSIAAEHLQLQPSICNCN